MAQDFCTELYLEMRLLSTICKRFFKGDNRAISCFEFCFGLHVIAVHLCLCVSLSGQSGLPDPESLLLWFEKVSRLTPAYTTNIVWELSKVLKCTP